MPRFVHILSVTRISIVEFNADSFIKIRIEVFLFFNQLVDCKWSEWRFGNCSKECGSGIRIDVRDIEIQPLNGGKECKGESNITENCNNHQCPGTIDQTKHIC